MGRGKSPELVGDRIAEWHALATACVAQICALLPEFESSDEWRRDGAPDVAAWLTERLRITNAEACRLVRTSVALKDLPQLSEAFAGAELSWDQARELARFVTPETEKAHVEDARGWSARDCRLVAQRACERKLDQENDQHSTRYLRHGFDLEHGTYRVSARLPASAGEGVSNVLVDLAKRGDRSDSWEMRLADALVEVCASTGAGAGGRPALVVHVDETVLDGRGGVAVTGAGNNLTSETVRRIACDCKLVAHIDDPEGRAIGIGRVSRSVPPWLRRHIAHRDDTCRFPGCERRLWTDAHHIIHWADGGPTEDWNLVLLCGHHHRLVHECGWRMEGDANVAVRFFSPDGQAFPRTRSDVMLE